MEVQDILFSTVQDTLICYYYIGNGTNFSFNGTKTFHYFRTRVYNQLRASNCIKLPTFLALKYCLLILYYCVNINQ